MGIIQELKRRNVIRVGLAYVLAAWLLLQIVDFVLEVITAPDWILQVFVLAAAVGLPVALVFAWVFEMTPEGIKRESEIDRTRSITSQTGRKLDRVIIVTLSVAVIFLLADKFLLSPGSDPGASPKMAERTETPSSSANAPQRPIGLISARSIAVLPFIAMSQGLDDEYFADGLTEEILNSLAQLPELLVTARTSAFAFKGKEVPVQEIAETLGVKHIVEGSVRRSGDRLRVTAQLIRANDGFHLWSENYDSTSEDTIAVQEDIAEKIALAMDVVMDEQKREKMRRIGLRDVEAFIAFQKGVELYEDAHGSDDQIGALLEANRYLEIVTERVPGYPQALSMHTDVYVHTLLNDATEVEAAPREVDVSEALELAIADYQAAIANARTPDEKNNLEIDLAFVTGNWRGVPARIERFLASSGCDQFTWLDPLAIALGYGAGLPKRELEFRMCDPLSPSSWWSEIRALLWAGDLEQAFEVATMAVDTVQHDWVNMAYVMALGSLGKFDQAEAEIDTRFRSEQYVLMAHVFIAAQQGDREIAAGWDDRLQDLMNHNRFWDLLSAAWMGDRERANRVAAEIDQTPFGPVALTLINWWCTCGGPWEIEATPRFAAMVAETGRSWPQPSPIRFPLKNW